jgi:hypothetical protein
MVKKITLACLDSEFYNIEVIEYLRQRGTKFCIVDKTSSVKELIRRIDRWEHFKESVGYRQKEK